MSLSSAALLFDCLVSFSSVPDTLGQKIEVKNYKLKYYSSLVRVYIRVLLLVTVNLKLSEKPFLRHHGLYRVECSLVRSVT